MTSPVTPSVISLLAEDFGQLPLVSQVSPTTVNSGRDRVRVSRSQRQEKEQASMIQGICGRTFTDSLAPEGPLSSWENRLRERLAMVGSTESALIWKAKTTPAGQSISRLAPSTRLINGTDFTGLRAFNPTPDASLGGPDPATRKTGKSVQTIMASYNPTPTVADVQGGRKSRSGARSNEPLLNGLLAAYSPTPTSLSFKDSHQPGNSRSLNLMRAHFETVATGPIPNGSSAPSTAKRGVPNPAFPFWLMGFPDAWTFGALAAMQSFRSSRPKSSRRS